MNIEIPEGYRQFPITEGFADHAGPLYTKVVDGKGSLGVRVLPHHANPVGICHGGVMMTLMDMAIGQAIMLANHDAPFVPSINLTFDFLKPAKLGEWLYSEVDFVHSTRRMGFANGVLFGSDGPILRCNGICKIPRSNDPTFGQHLRVLQAPTE
jgi:uncharacterized protein (TIGR00369 family)